MPATTTAREVGRRTKIVCTLGPATASEAMIQELARAGMEVARVNFSHGSRDDHRQMFTGVRAASEKLDRPLGLLADLSGAKLRLGEIPGDEMVLRAGEQVLLDTASEPAPGRLPLPVPELAGALAPGQRLLLGDGGMALSVQEVRGSEIRAAATAGGLLRSRQGLHAPGARLAIRAVTDKDLEDLEFALGQGADWVAMSFVRSARDLEPLREAIRRARAPVRLMAKIETQEAVQNLEEIVAVSDGLMVARGDLGIEMEVEQVPVLQKTIIGRANRAGKVVVTATQMLESMVHSPRPTRAEVSDVANAVLDGTDAVMLSGETAIGDYPVEAVRVMARAVCHAEAALDFGARLTQSMAWPAETVTQAISEATCHVARELGAKAIITATLSGRTACMVAMHRPETPIVAVTPDVATLRRLTLVWGVRPLLAERGRNTDELIRNAVAAAERAGLVRAGDVVVITAGVAAQEGGTNMIEVEVVGRRPRERGGKGT